MQCQLPFIDRLQVGGGIGMCMRKQRSAAAASQNYSCWYCGFPMWEAEPEVFARSLGLTVGQVGRFRCTAEHLVARSAGGGGAQANVVAACLFCNATRHKRRRPPVHDRYREQVRRAVGRGEWHPDWAHDALTKRC